MEKLMPLAFDTHCHLTDPRYDDLLEIIRRFAADGIGPVLVPGYDLQSSQQAAALGLAHSAVYCAAGVHPHDAASLPGVLEGIKALLANPKCVAVGEIGLDYHYPDTDRVAQQKAFVCQLELAAAHGLPVLIHMRDATADTLAILAEHMPAVVAGRRKNARACDCEAGDGLARAGGVMHCFSGSVETAQQAMALGLDISFAGAVTFKNAKSLQAVAAAVPLERMWIETDAPYLAPHPHRGARNQPVYVRLVAEKIAEIKGLGVDEVIGVTARNARRVLGIQAAARPEAPLD